MHSTHFADIKRMLDELELGIEVCFVDMDAVQRDLRLKKQEGQPGSAAHDGGLGLGGGAARQAGSGLSVSVSSDDQLFGGDDSGGANQASRS